MAGQFPHRSHPVGDHSVNLGFAGNSNSVLTIRLRLWCYRRSSPSMVLTAFPNGDASHVAPNTVVDLARYQNDLRDITPGNQVQLLNISGIAKNYKNGYIGSWTAWSGPQLWRRKVKRSLRGHDRHSPDAGIFPEQLRWRRSAVRALYGIRFFGARHRRVSGQKASSPAGRIRRITRCNPASARTLRVWG